MNKSEQINELAKGLALFRANLKQPFKDANNPFFKSKYVPLENVTEVIDKALVDTGVTYVQVPVNGEGGMVGVSTTVLHSSGQWLEFPPFLLKPDKANPQGYGSSITYARRYSLSSVFGVTSDNDDDGNAASGNGKQPARQAKAPANPQMDDNTRQTLNTTYADLKKLRGADFTSEQYIKELCQRNNANDIAEVKQSDIVMTAKLMKSEAARKD